MNDKKIRLNKAIALSGNFSRRKADELIKAGKVKVNNKATFDLSCKVSDADLIQVNGQALKSKEHKYFLFYKPCGYITTRKDEFNRKTIYDLLPLSFKYLKPVGRLDRDTEGLLILTNDGDFINKILHPSKNIKKTYMVETNEFLSIDEANFVISKLLSGVRLDEKICKADYIAQVPMSAKNRKHTVFKTVIHEGINRQIRRMFQVLGYSVSRLKRIKIGHFNLSELQKGKYRELDKEKAYAIFNSKENRQ